MANAKKSTLTTPESQADVTYIRIVTAEINLETGQISGVYCKCTAADEAVGSGTFSFACPSGNLATIENEIITQADAASVLPAGTVGDA